MTWLLIESLSHPPRIRDTVTQRVVAQLDSGVSSVNARLMTAAPDLLEKLRGLLVATATLPGEHIGAWNEALQAVADARGTKAAEEFVWLKGEARP